MTTYLQPSVPEDSVQRFGLYRRRFEKLKSSRFLDRKELENTLNFNINAPAQTINITHKAPDDETVEYFATQLRPFVLTKDATCHEWVCGEAKRYISDRGLNAWCALAGKEYQALMLNPRLTGIPIYLGDDRVLTPKMMFDLFMGSEGPHVFFEHSRQMKDFGEFVAFLKLNFVKLCLVLHMNPFQVLSDTVGIAMGDLAPNPKGLAGPSAKRVEDVEQMIKEGRLIHDTKLADQTLPFPRMRFGNVKPLRR